MVSIDSTGQGIVKLGDFGLARSFRDTTRSLSSDGIVVTLYYRCPELLLMTESYGPKIDVWSAGCIFLELALLRPAFPGKEVQRKEGESHEIFQKDQMRQICKFFNAPRDLGSLKATRFAAEIKSPKTIIDPIKFYFGAYGKEVLHVEEIKSFITHILAFLPEDRYDAAELLKHKVFTRIAHKTRWNCRGSEYSRSMTGKTEV